MHTFVDWNASVSGNVSDLRSRWNKVRTGLRLVVVGYCLALAIAVPGLILLCLNQLNLVGRGTSLLPTLRREQIEAVGWVVHGTGMALGFGLLILGQWLCLTHAPHRHSARELMFTCFLCVPLGPACLAVSWCIGGLETFKLLVEIADGLRPRGFLQGVEILQLTGLVLVLVNIVLFTTFLRAVSKCMYPSKSPQTAYYWFVVFLVGASVGGIAAPTQEIWLGLGAGWGVALCWHLVAIWWTNRSIKRVLFAGQEQQRLDRNQRSRPFSGFHRSVAGSP